MDGQLGRLTPNDQGARLAYDAMAPAYDDFTARYDYELWIDGLLELAARHGVAKGSVLDVACGTGKSFLPMLSRGWRVTACDLSPEMVRVARAKVDAEVSVKVADMRELPIYGSFDLVCCLNDALNYLLTRSELVRTLRSLASNLGAHSLLLFDANTLWVYRDFFSKRVEVESTDGLLIWDGCSSGKTKPGEVSEAIFQVESRLDEKSVTSVMHRQRHHPESDVRAALSAAKLELVGLYGHDYRGIPHEGMNEEEDTKAIYVARLATQRPPRDPATDGRLLT